MAIYSRKTSLQSLFKRSQLAMFALTFSICTIIFVVVSTYTMNTYAKQSLNILAEALSERIQPAMVFNDRMTMQQILSDYTTQYSIRSIQVLDPTNQEIANSKQVVQSFQSTQGILDHLFFKQPIQISIRHNQQFYGSIVVYGSSQSLLDFFFKILIGLCSAIILILFALLWSVRSTYQYLMQSIHPLVSTAREISEYKAYQLRLPHSNIKELQQLNDVFNELLDKIQASTQKLRAENDVLAHQALHDQLTQLPNRHYFYQTLLSIFEQPAPHSTALFFIDNNNFKEINDRYGHLAGDAVLQEMARRLKDRLRQDDFIARLGGDEFAILIRNISKTEHLAKISENLLKCCEQPLQFEQHEIHFSFSIGIASTEQAHSPEDLITAADSAMYKAKTLQQGWYFSLR
ncbi:sensor domain-containing diguanylate cyclase [Acinetobacter zhairhuonensis]|uniref:sensor domain-containing diguanylate cyclase n=1 Tax=Acinetobacter sp. A7.4 TaxID=2919921 RepID=UPI001F4F7B9E|nr:sensor domain-containing diguanylate cyclase [Acinetobacter sp. A7.4]MCJ8163196.1 diguanylate cyclase [Acinetobacter sp. A7.4]